MSAIAILDFGGANELFHQMSVLAHQGRLDFQAHAAQEPGGDDMPPPDLDPMVRPKMRQLDNCYTLHVCVLCASLTRVCAWPGDWQLATCNRRYT